METLRSTINRSRFTAKPSFTAAKPEATKMGDLKIGFDDTPFDFMHIKRKRDVSPHDNGQILTNFKIDAKHADNYK